LDELEARLGLRRYLVGRQITERDWSNSSTRPASSRGDAGRLC